MRGTAPARQLLQPRSFPLCPCQPTCSIDAPKRLHGRVRRAGQRALQWILGKRRQRAALPCMHPWGQLTPCIAYLDGQHPSIAAARPLSAVGSWQLAPQGRQLAPCCGCPLSAPKCHPLAPQRRHPSRGCQQTAPQCRSLTSQRRHLLTPSWGCTRTPRRNRAQTSAWGHPLATPWGRSLTFRRAHYPNRWYPQVSSTARPLFHARWPALRCFSLRIAQRQCR